MSTSRAPEALPDAGVGPFPFSLRSDELRERVLSLIASAERELDHLLDPAGTKTIQAFLDPLNRLLARVQNVSFHANLMFHAHPDPSVRTTGRETSEAAERFLNAVRTNERVYRGLLELPMGSEDPATRFAVTKMLREMRRAGVELDPAGRARVLELSNQIDSTSNEFAENIANSIRFIELGSASDLDGMPADYIAAHPPGKNGRIRITVDYPDLLPILTFCNSAEVRRLLFREAMNRAYPENVPVVERLLRLRAELARLLGYPNFAAYAIEDKMLKNPEAVHALLDRAETLLRPRADREFARQLERKRRDDPRAERLGGWDLRFMTPGYYEQKLVEEELGDTTGGLREYLPYGRVRDGLFRLCEELFELTITPAVDAEVWHPSVEAYEVHSGKKWVGRFYLDLVPRDGKYTHNATYPVRIGVEGIALPQAALLCNFLDPRAPLDSARLQHGDVVTFFHEFGHLLHNLFSGHGRWLYNTWLTLEWDFIEVPSQLFEEWARDPAVLARFAQRPDTGERPPPAMLERLREADKFGRSGYWLVLLAWSLAALELYERDPSSLDIPAVMRSSFARYSPIPYEPDYHLETCWPHLPGYSAYVYTYLWSMILARDILRPFQERGSLIDPEVSHRYMTEVLAPGSSRPAADLFRTFVGRDFSYDAFEQWIRGGG